MIVCIVVMAISVYQLYSIYHEYAVGTNLYKTTSQRFTFHIQSTEDNNKTMTTQITPPIQVDFDRLLVENPDVIGWLYCEGTPIDYPILQGSDNDRYLYQMLDGSINSSGSIFMDYRFSPDFNSFNTIIYGHNMKNDSMFGTLHNYSNQGYYDSHPIMWLLTPDANYRIDLLAGYISAASTGIYDIISNEEQLESHLLESLNQSNFVSSADVSEVRNIVILSTCSYEYDESRYILLGVPVLIH